MYSVPIAIWNRIAKEHELKTDYAMRLFNCVSDQELWDELDNEGKTLAVLGMEIGVRSAFLLTRPLLTENEAISDFIVKNEFLKWRTVLPELVSIDDAIWISTQEYRLTGLQQEKLRCLLHLVFEE